LTDFSLIIFILLIIGGVGVIAYIIYKKYFAKKDPEVITLLCNVIKFVYRAVEDTDVDKDNIYTFNEIVVKWVTEAYIKQRDKGCVETQPIPNIPTSIIEDDIRNSK